jgi:YD repeat-containing protein
MDYLLFMIRSFCYSKHGATTRDNSATTRVEWDALGQLIRKASEELPYPKRASGEASLQSIMLVVITAMGLQTVEKDYASFFLKP